MKFEMEMEPHTPKDKERPCLECALQSGPMCLDRKYCEFPKTGKTWRKKKSNSTRTRLETSPLDQWIEENGFKGFEKEIKIILEETTDAKTQEIEAAARCIMISLRQLFRCKL